MTIQVTTVGASQCGTSGKKIITLIAEYPRAIHSQLLTHRLFSKNSSSSRAIPIKSAIDNVLTNPAEFKWTVNQSGMQGLPLTDPDKLFKVQKSLEAYLKQTINFVNYLGLKEEEGGLNIHKQNVGRYLEPFQNIRIVLTSTEWDNWDWLRIDEAAQGEIEELALKIKQARDSADYMLLNEGEYHVPFVNRKRNTDGSIVYYHPDTANILTTEEAILISLSVCAQTSYRKEDTTLEKAKDIVDKLFSGAKKHLSPTEHIATPIPSFIDHGYDNAEWPKGITHIDRDHNYWSGNFKDWIQYRHLKYS